VTPIRFKEASMRTTLLAFAVALGAVSVPATAAAGLIAVKSAMPPKATLDKFEALGALAETASAK
jgi:hypothetical protein